MSLSLRPQKLVKVLDPIINVNNEREYVILEGGSQVSYKPFTTTSISDSAIQFNCPPPSPKVIVNRKLYILIPMRVTLNAGTVNTQPKLLRANYDAPRAWPFASITNTVQIGINDTSVSVNMSDVIHPLLRFNTDQQLKEGFYSTTPSSLDQSVNYSDLQGSIRNPLAQFGDSNEESVMARGAYPFTIVSDNGQTAIIDFCVAESIWLSPFYFGLQNAGGFIGVQTMDFTFNILANSFSRVWSHDNSDGNVLITSGNVQFNNFAGGFSYSENVPKLLFNYITPKELMSIPETVTYPYFDIQRYPTDGISLAIGAQNQSISSNNIQLNSIPRRLYLYTRVNNTTLQSNNSYTDTYLPITGININWDNHNSLLSNLTAYDIYLMAKKNHYNGSWTDWSGQAIYAKGSLTNQIYTSGSIACIELGTDIGLGDTFCPGVLGTFQLQVILTVSNNTGVAITASLYIISVSEGTFTIENNRSVAQIGVISKQDIMNAKTNETPYVDYYDIQEVNGGNFFNGLKNFGTKIYDFAKKAWPYVKRGFQIAKKVAPAVLPLLGLGGSYVGGCDDCDGDMENIQDMEHSQNMEDSKNMEHSQNMRNHGGELVGGKMMRRRNMYERMRR